MLKTIVSSLSKNCRTSSSFFSDLIGALIIEFLLCEQDHYFYQFTWLKLHVVSILNLQNYLFYLLKILSSENICSTQISDWIGAKHWFLFLEVKVIVISSHKVCYFYFSTPQ